MHVETGNGSSEGGGYRLRGGRVPLPDAEASGVFSRGRGWVGTRR